MSSITLKTLTPIHVGSGREFMGNFEYLYFEEHKCVAVIDDKKLLQLIGTENIEQWVKVVQRQGDLLEFLNLTVDKEITPEMVAHPGYIIPVDYGTLVKEVDKRQQHKAKFPNIRAQIRTGLQGAMIPGSSVKGAVRTAFLASQLHQQKHLLKKVKNGDERLLRNRKGYDDSNLIKRVISVDPFHDVFRLWRLGDLTFNRTICVPTQVLNRKQGGNYDLENGKYGRNLQQWLEAIPVGSSCIVPWNDKTEVAKKIYEKIQPSVERLEKKKEVQGELKGYDGMRLQKESLFLKHLPKLNWAELARTINRHTLHLLKRERDYWQQRQPQLPSDGIIFIEKLNELIEIGRALNDNSSCLLRLGYGSGWKSITGDWQYELLGKQYDKREKGLVASEDIPKTRRMANGQPMGFVKLSLVS